MIRLLCVALLATALRTASAQTVDEVIDKHIAAMGGASKLASLKSMKMEAAAQVMGMEFPSSTTVVQGRGLRSETTVQGMTIVNALDGDKGWMINPMAGQNTAVALPEEQVKLSAGQLDLTGLYNYKQKGHTAQLAGEDKVNGAPVYVVKVKLNNGMETTHYISKETNYILKTATNVQAEGQNMVVNTSFSNFKQVDGLTLPFTTEIESAAMPGGAMTMTIKSVQVNPTVDESIFAMPKN
ncbi:hypothetical protein GCM10027275_34410 [Rhabdobacter roseus]